MLRFLIIMEGGMRLGSRSRHLPSRISLHFIVSVISPIHFDTNLSAREKRAVEMVSPTSSYSSLEYRIHPIFIFMCIGTMCFLETVDASRILSTSPSSSALSQANNLETSNLDYSNMSNSGE